MDLGTSQRGVSLVELCVATAIVGVLLAAGLPAMQKFRQSQRLQAVAQTVMTDLKQLRSEAIQAGEAIHMRISQHEQGSCYILHNGASGACRCESETETACSGEARVLKQEWMPVSRGISVRANVTAISFQPRQGTATVAGRIEITGSDGTAIHHVVSVAGRTRSCTPSAGFANLPRC